MTLCNAAFVQKQWEHIIEHLYKKSDFFAQQQGYFLALGKTKSATFTILPM